MRVVRLAAVLGASAALVSGAVLGTPASSAAPVRAASAAFGVAGGSDVQVGSYNISGVNGDKKASGEHRTWPVRRPVMAKQVFDQHLDVIGLQEANQSSIYAKSLKFGKNQYSDLVGAVNYRGGHYAITNSSPYNCARAYSTYRCTYRNRQASGDNRIMYNTDTLSLVGQGSVRYAAQSAGKNARYLVWATFTVKATGHQFFFTTTHLDPYDVGIRTAQWSQLIDLVNQLKGNLPVVSVGDFNTSKFTSYAARYLPAMQANGFGDVLNQKYKVSKATAPRAESTTLGWVNSYNGYRRGITPYAYEDQQDRIGNGIDFIFASNELEVKNFGVVANVDTSTMELRGVIPSDHFLIRATLVL